MPGPVEPEYHHESTVLQTVNQLITKSQLHSRRIGIRFERQNHCGTQKIRDGIYEKRRQTQPLSKQLQQGRQSLKSTPPSKSKESPPTSLEKAVISRRPFVEPSDDEEDFSEQDWETEGSGIASADKLIHRLYVSKGSIKAGNNSIKLKNQVFSLLDLLVGLGAIAKQQRTVGRQVSHDFTINFQPPIYLGSGNYKAALNKLITMSYTWCNIDASYGSNKIRWRKKTEEWKTLIFPNGIYDYSDINSFL